MRSQGLLYILITAGLFGLGTVLTKLLVTDVSPLLLTVLTLAGGGAVLAVVLVSQRIPLVPPMTRTQWQHLLLLAVFGTALPLMLIAEGFGHTTAVKGSFLIQVNGLAALGFAVLLLRERLTSMHLLGAMGIIVGSVLVARPGTQVTTWAVTGGDGLVLAGAIGLGYAYIPAKQLAQLHALQTSALRLLLGAAVLLPVLALRFDSQILHVTQVVLWALPLLVVSSYGVAYLTLQLGLRLLPVWASASAMQTLPLFSLLFAIALLGDTLTVPHVAGGTLVVAGGVVLSLASRRAPQAGAAPA